jgi:hypothetical protein
MTTDADRGFARELAAAIYRHHVENGRSGCDANHIASNISYQETLYRGILTEIAFGGIFGLSINSELLAYGDGGRDFWLRLFVDREVRNFQVNVKSKSVQISWPALRRSGTHLRVSVSEIKARTIYVFGIYLEQSDEAEALRWEWGRTLIDEGQRAVFDNGNGEPCYIKLFDELRDLGELLSRMRPPPGFVGFEGGQLLHYCSCGAWGAFGYNVSLIKNKLGSWYCREHRPDERDH